LAESGISRKYEEYAFVLDYLPHGRPSLAQRMYRTAGVVQLLGELYFTLLEAALRENTTVALGERLYIGRDPRYKIAYIIGRVDYKDLTSSAQTELPIVLEKAVKAQEKRFIAFFNGAQALTPRMHALELLPGVGKRYMWIILGQREKKPFTSFGELKQRTGIHEPVKLVGRRILEELSEEEPKYRIFTRGP